MAPVRTMRNILMELRKICQHPYLTTPDLESFDIPEKDQHDQLIEASGKLKFLKLLLPKLKERGHRVLLFSQFKIALDRIEDFLYEEGVKFLRLDGDVQQAQRQKSMDLFNAPNSEFDVFLLTTRAGGVGINLATADTVIIYDPDFNPHQDLQAIARSHRYGQKKKVLVFKLMVKGSVEENIINKGKKKMVLDHLVVQQMGKESEEGDIDDLLLRGAEAVYANQGGMNVPDIVYNSKNVDELIDKVEADADLEAKAIEERDKAIAEGREEAINSKSTQQFGFAKIWEAGQNQLMNITDDNDGDDEGTRETDWQAIIEAMEKESQIRLDSMTQGPRGRRKAAERITFTENGIEVGGTLEDKTPEKKKKKWKGKGKMVNQSGSGSGSDYNDNSQPPDIPSESDEFSDSFIPEELRALDLPGIKKMSKRDKFEWEAAKAVQTIRDGPIPSVPAPSNFPLPLSTPGPLPTNSMFSQGQSQPAASTSSKRPGETTEEKTARRIRRRIEKQNIKSGPPIALVNGINQIALPQSTNHHSRPAFHPHQHFHPHQQQQHPFAEAQQILSFLYSILREFGDEKGIRRWGLIALPELSAQERMNRYNLLAVDTDSKLVSLGQPRYFSLPEQTRTVLPLFDARGNVIPDGDLSVPPIPLQAGLHLQPNRIIATPAAPPPPVTNGAIAGPSRALQASKSSESLFNNLMNVSPSTCQFCFGFHQLKDCKNLTSVADLKGIKKAILNNHETPGEKKTALKNIEKTQKWLIKAGKLSQPSPPSVPESVPEPETGPFTMNRITPTTSINLSQSTNSRTFSNGHSGTLSRAASQSQINPQPQAQIIDIAHSPLPVFPPPPVIRGDVDLCPFCKSNCGLPIRMCVDKNGGGRKALKAKIRKCEEKIQGGDGSETLRRIQLALYEVYKDWPR
ncbi:uncharacterized protein IL334_004912 [Kwoniella shivajii]|uniref:Helicase C-terminal domain-containing protein n=1 Tax=Kwoniella shivajii TaxID=564305 RepID=A0ABZ1D1U5_9TREE|nr:hypothetical protein IL334_004912 [Kwoniella shivajii]